jgi:hypothetical protein
VGEWEEVYSSEQLTHFENAIMRSFMRTFNYRQHQHKKDLSLFSHCKNLYREVLTRFDATFFKKSGIEKKANEWVKQIFGETLIHNREAKE